MKLTKKRYLLGFTGAVLVLAGVRAAFPQVAESNVNVSSEVSASAHGDAETGAPAEMKPIGHITKKHRILSVPNFKACFPDTQAVQLSAAMKYGVKRVKNREDAEKRKNELVYVGANPYYHIDPLYSSIPYLVPRAAVLLQDIGQAFFDSLYVKGIPLHRPIVTSVSCNRSVLPPCAS